MYEDLPEATLAILACLIANGALGETAIDRRVFYGCADEYTLGTMLREMRHDGLIEKNGELYKSTQKGMIHVDRHMPHENDVKGDT